MIDEASEKSGLYKLLFWLQACAAVLAILAAVVAGYYACDTMRIVERIERAESAQRDAEETVGQGGGLWLTPSD